ncbi:primosomal protein N' [Motilimonas pumila]|uniref:Replication restart protein PriA n=1 Tax=Motilimonas pumila TaxID=2303987 RepID=A0A418YCW4_9GAMM|nr:primosomal protein N' [Motilimonas pumila]RJG42360.1 primosomal protein N' [Motilimonas pumila]
MNTTCSVAVPVPLRRHFDYLFPSLGSLTAGCRVKVSFRNREKIGLVINCHQHPDIPLEKLKPVLEVIDEQAIVPASLLAILQWASEYYHHPIGDVIAHALPSLLRAGEPDQLKTEKVWQLTACGNEFELSSLKRAVKQLKCMTLLQQQSLSQQQLNEHDISSAITAALAKKGLISSQQKVSQYQLNWQDEFALLQTKPELNTEQAIAVAAVTQATAGFAAYLLEGVTGSGKTEVYLNMIEPVLAKGQQVLILVPEIGLTPQTLTRFKQRFNVPIFQVHSELTDRQRLDTWLHARAGSAAIVIGTRSAIFTPFKQLGMIIIDEEHDSSFKQQDMFRYHGRDLAIMTALRRKIPIVLGSATPSLESLNNVASGKYHHLTLKQRAGNAQMAKHYLQDTKNVRLNASLSPQLIDLMQQHLQKGNQVMLFLNRRGYAPALMCHECGWLAQCQRCDAYYTWHQGENRMICHHCNSQRPIPHQCENCGSTQLIGAGVGTEQLETSLNELFPQYKTIRIDRDSTRKKGSLENYLSAIQNLEYRILIGTQMLAKGHHFPDVTLVGILDVDSALFSSDFRAAEKLAQLFTQVAGRAGRASKPGQVVLQSHHPEHYLLQDLVNNGYQHFASSALHERQEALLPPFTFQALFRAEATYANLPQTFLQQCQSVLSDYALAHPQIEVIGPMPAIMERRAGKYRLQLLIQAPSRALISGILSSCLPAIEQLKDSAKVRWSVDIDPTDFI